MRSDGNWENKLLQIPTSVNELLLLLDQVENFLLRVDQSSSKVAVGTCLTEITRISELEAPYDHHHVRMKKVMEEEKNEIKQSLQQEKSKEVKSDEQDETNKEDKVIHMLEATQLQKDTTEERVIEEREEIKKSLQQEQNKEVKSNEEDEGTKESKVIHMLETTQLQEMTKEKHENENIIKFDHQVMEGGKVRECQTDLSNKSNPSLKQNPKTRTTIPRPFSFSTEERMSKEKQRLTVSKDSKPILSKSASLNYKNIAKSSLCVERASGLTSASSTTTSTKTSLRPKVTTGVQVDKKVENVSKTKDRIQVKEVEKKRPQVTTKKQEGDELDSSKFRRSNTFKALPLPSFYQQKNNPSETETKKVLVAHSTSTLLGKLRKTVPTPPTSESRKTEENNNEKVLRKVTSTVKQTVSKLLKTTRKTPKDMVKGVVTSA